MHLKTNLSVLKLTIKFLILMIIFVTIFILSLVLYSSRYWPDVHNYINANITIKRIPTLSELNLAVLDIEWTTEFYTTIEEESSTVEGFDIDIDEFTNIQGELPKTQKSARIEKFENDYNELPTKSVVVDYTFVEDAATVNGGAIWKKIVKDLIDESKLVPKNLGDVEMVNRKNGKRLQKLVNICHGNTSGVSNIYPWIATIFIKNDSVNSQFQYTCDGALLGDKLIITAARCVIVDNSTVGPSDMVVFLGKKSLQNIGEDERHVRISQIKVHSNFTNADGIVHNDLALLVMEEPVTFSDSIRPACLGEDIAVENSATTAWNLTGTLMPVFFKKSADCTEDSDEDGTICATYGDEVPLCPSNGGLYASRRGPRWYLTGIRSGPPEFLCFTKEVHYTPLVDQLEWILENLE